MPGWFPVREYDETNQYISKRAGPDTTPWRNFASAWNAVGYRCIRMDDAIDYLVAAWSETYPPPFDDRMKEDTELFALAANMLSAVECAFLAAYCVAAMADPLTTPLATPNELKVLPSHVITTIRTLPQASAIADHFATAWHDITASGLKDLRDSLSHRGSPLRRISFSTVGVAPSAIPNNPKQLGKDWVFDLTLTDGLVQSWAVVTRSVVVRLVCGVSRLSTERLP